ncbi:MAG: hypothetical protein LUQ50_09700 [Methanospirillum sp.]|uniref:hypothetical protein n=1 Tax=Methanospirillum sp. TaxID=45200 RepID=UPI0023699827|nr:hypothetical protein [Methanospirillum sp.]MDD1729329.1 hypothetical protein [Methanospirillum sp.]
MTISGEKTLSSLSDGVFLNSDRYRIWIDDTYIGHVRVIKRINFSQIVEVLRQIVLIQREYSGEPGIIRIYIPHSLQSIYSDNLHSFIGFAQVVSNISIEVRETEEIQF